MMLTYRYIWEGSRLIVYEYEDGRRGHTYKGEPQGDSGVILKPITNGRDHYSRVPYKLKRTNWFVMTRLPDYDAPAPIEPPRAVPRADKQPEPEVLDNSEYTGVQIKLIN